MPIVYTPTVGQACKEFGHIFRRGRGLYITAADADRIDDILADWPMSDVAIIVVTDGEDVVTVGVAGGRQVILAIAKVDGQLIQERQIQG